MRRAAKTALVLVLAVVVGAAFVRASDKLPAPEKLTLKNGITVYYLKSADLPLVSFRMWIRGAGTADEPAALDGAASLTADLLMKGTAKMDADAVAEAVDFMGARLDISAGDEYASVSGESLAEHFPRVMEIAADCLMNSVFKEDEFAKERKTRLDSLKAVKDNPGAAIRSYFVKAYYGSHPLGHLANGTETSLNKITLADIKSFYQKTYRPERGIAAVVGSMEKAGSPRPPEHNDRPVESGGRGLAYSGAPGASQARREETDPGRQAGRHPGLLDPRRVRLFLGR